LRRRPDFHSRLMVLATLRLLPPATTRIPLTFIQNGGIPVLVGDRRILRPGLFVIDTVRNRRVHPRISVGRPGSDRSRPGIDWPFDDIRLDWVRSVAYLLIPSQRNPNL
jgi:hypothetical protein